MCLRACSNRLPGVSMVGRSNLAKAARISGVVGLALVLVALFGTAFSCAGSSTAATTAAPPNTAIFGATTLPTMVVQATMAPPTTIAEPRTTTTATPIPETSTSTTPSTTPPTTAAPEPPLIVLDPGHSGTSRTTIDPATQIRDEEYLNTPETQNMFEVATLLKAKLEAAGYRVLMTKQAWNDTVSKRDRVNVANLNHAALGVSLHTSGHTFGHYGQIYVQRMDSYRENIKGKKVYFALPEVAALSAKYGQIFLEERRKIEGSSVVITVNSGWGERGLAPGNLPIVQLFAQVPWILCEAGAPQNEQDKELYAQSMFNSIVKCVPIKGSSPQP